EFHLCELRPAQFLHRGRTDFDQPVPIAPGAVEERGASLDEALPDQALLRPLPLYRTPDGFQGLVRQPELPLVEQLPGRFRLRPPGFGGQAAPTDRRFRAPWQLDTVPTRTAAAAPVAPARVTIASPASTWFTANVPTPNTWCLQTKSAGP